MSTCEQCGASLRPKARFCPQCGRSRTSTTEVAPPRRWWIAAVGGVVALAAGIVIGTTVGGGDDGTRVEARGDDPTTEPPPIETTTPAPAATAGVTSTVPVATSPPVDPSPTPVPQGDLDAPENWMCVTGVAADDTLNVRTGPGTEHTVVYELLPRACDIYPLGPEHREGDAHWIEIEHFDHLNRVTGWVNADYLRSEPNPCHWRANGCGL